MKLSDPTQREREDEGDFQGAVLDAQGREIPISEAMIQRACRRLERKCTSLWAGLPRRPQEA